MQSAFKIEFGSLYLEQLRLTAALVSLTLGENTHNALASI